MKTRRRKMPKLKRRREAPATRRRGPTVTDLQKQLDQRTRRLSKAQKDLAEALEQQTATTAILEVAAPTRAQQPAMPVIGILKLRAAITSP